MIDTEKWESADAGTKYDYISTTLSVEDEKMLTRPDLLMMCKFLLEEANTLKRENAERKGGKE